MLLPTSVVGSHGLPGWVWLAREAMEAGRLGPIDVRELTEDATQAALLDQERAGIDVMQMEFDGSDPSVQAESIDLLGEWISALRRGLLAFAADQNRVASRLSGCTPPADARQANA